METTASGGDFRQLLGVIEASLYDGLDIDPSQLLRTLHQAKPSFANLLAYKENSAQSRAQIISRRPVTPMGTFNLDDEPDVREVLLLSDEFKLDEIVALMCVEAARQERNEVSAADAAGVYFEERRSLLVSLWMLLQAQVMSAESLPGGVYRAVCAFNEDLLAAAPGGSVPLIARLLELIRAHSLEAQPGSRLAVVIDAFGREVDRSTLVQREQLLCSECLVYVACIRQRLGSRDVLALLDLLHHLGLKLQGSGPGDLVTLQQGYGVLMALLLALLPLESATAADAEADERALGELLADAALEHRVVELHLPDDPYAAVAKLAWGTAQAAYGAEGGTARTAALVQEGLRGGALRALQDLALGSEPMRDEAPHQRELYAGVVHQLLMLFLDTGAGRDSLEGLCATSLAEGLEEITGPPDGKPPAGALMEIPGTQSRPPRAADTLGALLRLLSSVFDASPDLFLDKEQRHEAFGQFMDYVAQHEVMQAAPSVFLAYVKVLTSLASGQQGARSMFMQLRGENTYAALSWRRMFEILVQVVRQYVPEPDTYMPSNGGGSSVEVQQRSTDFVLPACDSAALCAYLDLFRRIMSESAADEVATWLQQLEDDAGVSPVWEVLFQIMCCPVPQDLKAATDRAIAALCRSPELSSTLWERLVAAVVVAPLAPDQISLPRYDLTYQLNEIETRAEDYSEALAFVELLNALWGAMLGSLLDDGRAYAHLSKFVHEDLLATVYQRPFKEEGQRWQLVSACLAHCRLNLAGLRSASAYAGEAASTGSELPPGVDVLVDILGERSIMRVAMATLMRQVDEVAHDRHAAPFGGAKEAAVLAALQLLNSVFERDTQFVEQVKESSTGSYEPLDAVLRHERQRIPLLLDYVRYPHNPAVQVEALRSALHLTQRLPNLVSLLLTAPTTGAVPIVSRLQDGFAACLEHALFTVAVDCLPTDDALLSFGGLAASDGGGCDTRADLVLELLLSSLEQPAPTLTHLLCGFDVESGTGLVGIRDPREAFTPLRVVLDAAQSQRVAKHKPRAYEQCLELLYELAAAPGTGEPVLGLLRGRYSMLVGLLGQGAMPALPEDPAARAASLHQLAWLLQLYTLELHGGDLALSAHRQSVGDILAALFSSEGPAEMGSSSAGYGSSRMASLLRAAAASVPQEPQLAPGTSADMRRLIQGLGIDALLASTARRDEGGVRVLSAHGASVFDVVALKDEMLVRYNEWVVRHGTAADSVREACRLGLQYSQQYNSFMEEIQGVAALVAAWKAVVLVACTRRFGVLMSAVNCSNPLDLILDMVDTCLATLAGLLAGPGLDLAPALCETVQALLARAHEQATALSAKDPAAAIPLPSWLHKICRELLAVIWEGREHDAIKGPMFGALVSYLGMARSPALLHAPPAVLDALLQGFGSREMAIANLDELLAQLEEGNVALLRSNLRSVDVMVQDATAAAPQQATYALAGLAAILAADPSRTIANELYRRALPACILQDLPGAASAALAQVAPASHAVMLVVEAQLTVLLRLVLSGPPAGRAAAAQQLFSAQVLSKLAACTALDVQPEEPGYTYAGGSSALRHRLHQLITPALRLVVAVVSALRHSTPVVQQAAAFVDAHARMVARLLHEAASPGVRGWEPSDAEVEGATLALDLLAELAPHQALLDSGAQLQEAAYRLSSRFLCLSSKSLSPVITKTCAAREHGRLSLQQEQSFERVLSLRCALSRYLLQLSVVGAAHFRCMPHTAVAGGQSLEPTLFLLKDALLQAVSEDLPDVLAEQPTLLAALQSPERYRDANLSKASGSGGSTSSPLPSLRVELVLGASMLYRQLAKLLFLSEHLLAAIMMHLRSSALPGNMAGGIAVEAGGAQERLAPIKALGSERDLAQLRRLLEPVILQLEQQSAGIGTLGHDQASLFLLLRRTKEQLSRLQ